MYYYYLSLKLKISNFNDKGKKDFSWDRYFSINENGRIIDIFFLLSRSTRFEFYYYLPNKYLLRSTSYAQHPMTDWYQMNIDNAKRVKTRTRNCTQFYDDYLPLKFSYLTRNDICKCVQQSTLRVTCAGWNSLVRTIVRYPGCVNNLPLSNSAATQYRLIKIYRVHGNSTNCLSPRSSRRRKGWPTIGLESPSFTHTHTSMRAHV